MVHTFPINNVLVQYFQRLQFLKAINLCFVTFFFKLITIRLWPSCIIFAITCSTPLILNPCCNYSNRSAARWTRTLSWPKSWVLHLSPARVLLPRRRHPLEDMGMRSPRSSPSERPWYIRASTPSNMCCRLCPILPRISDCGLYPWLIHVSL